jgi:hypothetical protein
MHISNDLPILSFYFDASVRLPHSQSVVSLEQLLHRFARKTRHFVALARALVYPMALGQRYCAELMRHSVLLRPTSGGPIVFDIDQ